MISKIEPDYDNYIRLQTIFAFEAEELLAVFELRGKKFGTQREYDDLFEQKIRLASRVLCEALDCKKITYSYVGIPYKVHGPGDKEYDFNVIKFGVKDFFKLAMDLNYNLPDVLVAFVTGSNCNNAQVARECQIVQNTTNSGESQVIDSPRLTEETPKTNVAMEEVGTSETAVAIDSNDSSNTHEPKESEINNNDDENNKINNASVQKTSQNKRRKGGPKKCTLSLAVEIAYLKLLEQGDTKVLMPGMRDAFMECFREMAADGNRNSHPGVLVLIKEVRKSKLGKYTIITHDRPNKANPKKIEEVSSEHGTSQVTRFLNSLRAKHPPIPK